ncbi:hypothetical protein HOM50_02520 [bacterium]|nr:hypothetical protein [bacterium]MBT5015257.1 hypothetical protein [bacterium]
MVRNIFIGLLGCMLFIPMFPQNETVAPQGIVAQYQEYKKEHPVVAEKAEQVAKGVAVVGVGALLWRRYGYNTPRHLKRMFGKVSAERGHLAGQYNTQLDLLASTYQHGFKRLGEQLGSKEQALKSLDNHLTSLLTGVARLNAKSLAAEQVLAKSPAVIANKAVVGIGQVVKSEARDAIAQGLKKNDKFAQLLGIKKPAKPILPQLIQENRILMPNAMYPVIPCGAAAALAIEGPRFSGSATGFNMPQGEFNSLELYEVGNQFC